MMDQQAITVAITGASGVQYALRLLECLVAADKTIYLLLSDAAREVIAVETELELPDEENLQPWFSSLLGARDGQVKMFSKRDWHSPVASGSAKVEAMVVCPCSGGTLSAIATGASNNLIERAADVMLKERRKLVLVPRETPVSAIHLENMHKLATLGVRILPASPGFYHQPSSINDLVDFVVARILDQLEISQTIMPPWGDA